MSDGWKSATKPKPCAACGSIDWCGYTLDGTVIRCMRDGQAPAGWRFVRRDANGGSIFMGNDGKGNGQYHATPRPRPTRPEPPGKDWSAEHDRLRGQMTAERLEALATATGVPAAAWAKLGPGWATAEDLRALKAGGAGWAENYPDGAWAFPERSGEGRVVGLSFRAGDGRKGFAAGGKRGLAVPDGLFKLGEPVLIVEGASDVAACCAMGLAAVGRPSNRSGAEDLAVLFDGVAVLVVGERDAKAGGAWPGRDGAKAVAVQLAGRWGEPVGWTLPPLDTKDIRAWLLAKAAAGLDLADAAAVKAAGAELRAALLEGVKIAKPEKRTQADAMVDLARAEYRLGISSDGEAFAVPLDGPAVALPFRGGASGLRMALAKRFRAVAGKTPSASALADALTALEGMAQDCAPEPLGLRVARDGGAVVLDLADAMGRVAVVTATGWATAAVSPVLFRRTALTAPLPEPAEADAGALAELRGLLNVGDDSWPLVVGWLVAALLADIPHPVLMLGGEQGTGKSTAARLLVELVDPSGATLRGEPRDAEQWAIAAAGSWAVALDNISHLSTWLSDAICKAVTGDGLVRRKLYSDSDLAVLSFKRCVLLTSIDAGALRGDLADRLLLVDLPRIPDARRRTEAELLAAYTALRPRLLGALLSALAKTLALPAVKLAKLPRMADFAVVLAALDTACPELTGGRAFELFAAQRGRIAGEVVESDPVAAAVVKFMEQRESWAGSAAALLAALSPGEHPPRGWPANARALAGRLRRVRPALAAVGIEHDAPADGDKSRTHTLRRVPAQADAAEPAPMADADGRERGEL